MCVIAARVAAAHGIAPDAKGIRAEALLRNALEIIRGNPDFRGAIPPFDLAAWLAPSDRHPHADTKIEYWACPQDHLHHPVGGGGLWAIGCREDSDDRRTEAEPRMW